MFTPDVPVSVLTAARRELSRVALELVDPTRPLPTELFGHYFLVAPVGTFSSNGRRPHAGLTTVMNGDGLVLRVDFDRGTATATARLARTPDFVADEVTMADPALAWLRFRDVGIARIGLLGARDFLNTAFLPAWPRGALPREMYLAFDSGRPFSIDPTTLDVRAPLAPLDFWHKETFASAPFPIVLTPAHPVFDPHTDELWTVNYTRSPLDILLHCAWLPPALLPHARFLAAALRGARAVGHGPLARSILWLARKLSAVAHRLAEDALAELGEDVGIPPTRTYVVRRSKDGSLAKVELEDHAGDPVEIKQSVHQVAVTRNWFVLLDTAFKLGVSELYNDPLPQEEGLEEIVRTLFTRPQLPCTVFWVVPRDAVDRAIAAGDTKVLARRVEIPVEATHFLADYDDTDGLVVHVGHSPATDLSEWVRPYDRNPYDGEETPRVGGFLAVGAMDVGRLGRHVIDPQTGHVTESQMLADDRLTWAVSLYAARDVGTDAAPPERIEKLFWATEGAYPELYTEFVHDLYAKYPHRKTPLAEIEAMGRTGGRPSAILRIDTKTMTIEDSVVFPDGTMPSSLQVIPHPTKTGALDGWLVGTMFTPTGTEIWIWDPRTLATPISKLRYPEPAFGFSLHCAWLPSIAPRAITAAERASLRDEITKGLDLGDKERALAQQVITSLAL